MEGTERKVREGHLSVRRWFAWFLIPLRHACVLGTVIAAASCIAPSGDEAEYVGRMKELVGETANALISILFLALLILWTMLVIRKTNNRGSTGDNNRDFVMMFGVLITGIFIFMTFRIDRGSRNEARRTAEEVSEPIAMRTATQVAKQTATEVATRISTRKSSDVAVVLITRDVLPREQDDSTDSVQETVGIPVGLFQDSVPEPVRDLNVDSGPEIHIIEAGDMPLWFRFEVPTPGRYRIMVKGVEGGGLLGFDPAICLYSLRDGSLKFEGYNDDSDDFSLGSFFDSQLDEELIPGINYYLAVVEISDSDGAFSIEIDRVRG